MLLEDLGSTNGSFINGKRVQRDLARPGDEIGFDTLRFRLNAPTQQESPTPAIAPTVAKRRSLSPWLWVSVAGAGLVAIWLVALLR